MFQNEPGGGGNRLVSVEESSDQADSVRQVLDDVEAHIERLRADAARLGRERAAALDTLEGIRASLAASPGMSGLDREELGLEVLRLAGRAQEVEVKVVTHRTTAQQAALAGVER